MIVAPVIAAVAAGAVRAGLVALFFPFSAALDKVQAFPQAVKQAEDVFSRKLAVAAILIGLAVEVFASLAVVTGLGDRMGALVLAGYCIVTAILFKRWWEPGDFWSNPGGEARSLFWDFLKNFSVASGFLLIVIGTDGSGLAPFLAHPLASSHPYHLISPQ